MSRLKLNFSASDSRFREVLNKRVNGFIQTLLGEGNKYHGTFSDYSLSSMQGAVWNEDDTYSFPNGGSVYVSSNNQEFINTIVVGLVSNKNLSIGDMHFIGFEVFDYKLRKEYDIVRAISPILVSTPERRMLTFKDEGFIDLLREKSIKKLILAGVDERKAKSIKFELFHPEKARSVCVKIGDAVNIGSRVMLLVRGNKQARETLYTMGIGKCTGFGFGAVSVNNK
jgi:CRISPR-associated endoribonuclease Cas6